MLNVNIKISYVAHRSSSKCEVKGSIHAFKIYFIGSLKACWAYCGWVIWAMNEILKKKIKKFKIDDPTLASIYCHMT